jgi:hypothetical protein
MIDDACKMLTLKRQEILREAHKYIINKQNTPIILEPQPQPPQENTQEN